MENCIGNRINIPVLNESGIITHYVAVKEDITEKKRAEETLRNINERYNLALKAGSFWRMGKRF